MNTINQSDAGCYLLSLSAFRITTENTFKKKVLQNEALVIDGIYTYPDTSYTLNYKNEKVYNARREGTDYYDYRNVSLLIDGTIHQGKFNDLHKNKMRFYINDEGDQAMMTMAHVTLPWHTMFENLYGKAAMEGHDAAFTILTNTPMPHMDMIATKLVSY